jgi:hypothetical protein
MGRIIKAKPPSMGRIMICGITLLLLGAEGAMIERGLLPTVSYRERERERGKKGKKLSSLRIELAQLRGVPWVLDVHPCLGVA